MKKTIRHYLTVSLVCCLLPLSSFAQVTEKVLSNGLKVVIKQDSRAPVAILQLWYKVGSVDEVNGWTGLSHLLEHMMFKGTINVPSGEFNRRIAAVGGANNAFTSRDMTVYHETLTADNLPLALKMEADRMVNLAFSDQEFKSELNVVKEERRLRTDDSPSGILIENMYASAFLANPVRSPVIGWMNDLDNMQPDDLRKWYQSWYAPNNTVIVIVGDVNPRNTLIEIERLFGNIPARVIPERRPQIEPEQLGIRRIQVSAVSELPYLALGWKVPNLQKISDRQPYALAILSAILGEQSVSRLPRKLVREQRIATGISSSYDLTGRAASLFMVSGIPASGITVSQLEKAVRNELAAIVRNGVTSSELLRIRRQLEASRVYAKDSIEGQAMQIGLLENLRFSWADDEKIDRMLISVTTEEVQKAAKSLLDDNLTIVVLNPVSATNKK